MTTTDIIQVIKACKQSGVRQFEANGVKLEFGPEDAAKDKIVIGIEDEQASERNIDEHEIRIKQEQLDALKIIDPFTYEQILAQDSGDHV